MDSINKFLEKLPASRGFLLALTLMALIAYQLMRAGHDGEAAFGRWQSAIDQRKASVERSIATLNIPDKALLGCLRSAAQDRARIHPESTGGIDDVRELQLLYCAGSNIKELTGIGAITSLRFTDLSSNQIRSIAPLENHRSLQSLRLTDNPVTSIDSLESLPSLKEVYLPDLPEVPCQEIERLVGDIKSNYHSIVCSGPTATMSAVTISTKNPETGFTNKVGTPAKLTAAQQQELLEYQREMRYQKQ